MEIVIKDRWTGTVLYTIEATDLREAVIRLVSRDANLGGANLRGADLGEANLSEANLSEADLSEADLGGADLGGANLRGANLRGANLRGADLSGANLRGANLRGANLRGANLGGADLSEANLSGADLSGADLEEITIPTVPNLDAAILSAIEHGGRLAMDQWHTCETTHCRAGWAITLAGDAGQKLEAQIGSCAAGALIYQASAGYVPSFYSSNDEALEDIRAHAVTAAE